MDAHHGEDLTARTVFNISKEDQRIGTLDWDNKAWVERDVVVKNDDDDDDDDDEYERRTVPQPIEKKETPRLLQCNCPIVISTQQKGERKSRNKHAQTKQF